MGFTPGVIGSSDPWLNPKAGKLSAWPSLARRGVMRRLSLGRANLVDGFRRSGYRTIGSGAVDWFDSSTETGAVLSKPLNIFFSLAIPGVWAISWPGLRVVWMRPRRINLGLFSKCW